jgi:hypothetical protein
LLALAEAGGADYLVTGDKSGLLVFASHKSTRIITATSPPCLPQTPPYDCRELWGKFGGPCAWRATFSYFVPQPNSLPSLLFSEILVQRKDLRKITCLAWAQEVQSSKFGAPTKHPVFSLAY